MDEYVLEHLYPPVELLLTQVAKFTRNMVLFLPKNTSIPNLIKHLSELVRNEKNELIIEIETAYYNKKSKGIFVYLFDCASIEQKEVVDYFY